MLSIGLMSGTSMDGIDAALIETDGEGQIKELAHISLGYVEDDKILLRAAEAAVSASKGDLPTAERCFKASLSDHLGEIQQLSAAEIPIKLLQLALHIGHSADYTTLSLASVVMHSTLLHIQAVEALLQRAKLGTADIDVIGYHGQTLLHRPEQQISIIIGDGQMMADRLGIKVVTQFRAADVAAGGMGAPFAPLYHYALAKRDGLIPAAVINCGGIANVTLIANDQVNNLVGFDSGPGNGLIDRLVKLRTAGREHMDEDGQYGLQGKVNQTALQALHDKAVQKNGKNYLTLPLPKALDINDLQLVPEIEGLSLEDACATLETFTAETIANSLAPLGLNWPPRVILAGGGWHNPVILSALKKALSEKSVTVLLAEEVGWHSQALEAQLFAYLAVRSLQAKPLSFPGTTGVAEAMTGGVMYAPQKVAQST